VTGLEHDALLYDFGAFAVKTTFARLYPALFAVSPSARAFLLTVETPVHELVRRVMPQSLPPKLVVFELDTQGVSIEYRSPRKLCVLLRGLVEGTAQHYGETAEITERSCMLQGNRVCRIDVRFQRAGA
jgi:heme-NO-binding protein